MTLSADDCSSGKWDGRARPDFEEQEEGETDVVERVLEVMMFVSEGVHGALRQRLNLSLLNQVMAGIACGPAPD